MTSCDICVEKFNKSTRLAIKCNYCDFVNCRTCFQKYLLDTQDPCCMNCKKIFTRDFISEKCTSIFVVGEYKRHRENVLLDREKSLIPSTQVYVVLEKEKNKIRDEIKRVERERAKILEQANSLTLVINQLASNVSRMTVGTLDQQERKKFVRKCPMENCRGFLSQQWKCGICDAKICNKCNEEKTGDEHVCNPDNVASMELLNRDTKPCPECGTMIFRISGCFAMDTPILLWNGDIKMSQNISIGDQLIGDDGNIRNVLDITSGIDTLYLVEQSDGISYTVNSKHTLLLKPISNNVVHSLNNLYIVRWFDHVNHKYISKKFRFNELDKIDVYEKVCLFRNTLNVPENLEIKIDDYMKLPDEIKSKLLGFKGECVNWDYCDIKIDPYLLGLWLGDGNSNGTGFASDDHEIIQYFIDWAEKNNLYIIHQDKYFFKINCYLNTRKPVGYEDNCKACLKKQCCLCSINNDKQLIVPVGRPLNIFRKLLNDYNLINNKHIPQDYLMNSRENRLKLLAGIIDTDGSVTNGGKRIIISQVNVKLSKQIILLAKSLGFIVHHRIVKKINIPFPNTDKLSECKDQYIINISGEQVDEIPTILPRKKCKSSTPNKDHKKTGIKVTNIGSGRYYGFLLDNNHKFVLEDFTACRNCSQMFCVDCHCAWNWNTGLIERGVVHNPHYYEFIRRGGNAGRNHGDIPCGGLPDLYTIRTQFSILVNYKILKTSDLDLLFNIHNCVTHIQHYEIRQVAEVTEESTRTLRIDYMLQRISEETFKRSLQEIEKTSSKRRDFNNIYQMFVDVASDIFRQMCVKYNEDRSLVDRTSLTTFFKENIEILKNLKNYFNDNIKKIGNVYKCVYPGICDNYRFHGNYKTHLERTAAVAQA